MYARLMFGLVAATVPMAGAQAQNMNAEVFHARATALQKKGAMALFSRGEINALTKEGKAAGAGARASRLAAIKAGKAPRFCPPEGPQRMDSDEFVRRLSAIPLADRQKIDMTEATIRILAVKFPCRP